MTEEDLERAAAHVRSIARGIRNRTLTTREKQLLAMLQTTIESLEQLDALLTIVPPDLFIYPVEQFKQWQRARDVAALARNMHASMLWSAEHRSWEDK